MIEISCWVKLSKYSPAGSARHDCNLLNFYYCSTNFLALQCIHCSTNFCRASPRSVLPEKRRLSVIICRQYSDTEAVHVHGRDTAVVQPYGMGALNLSHPRRPPRLAAARAAPYGATSPTRSAASSFSRAVPPFLPIYLLYFSFAWFLYGGRPYKLGCIGKYHIFIIKLEPLWP